MGGKGSRAAVMAGAAGTLSASAAFDASCTRWGGRKHGIRGGREWAKRRRDAVESGAADKPAASVMPNEGVRARGATAGGSSSCSAQRRRWKQPAGGAHRKPARQQMGTAVTSGGGNWWGGMAVGRRPAAAPSQGRQGPTASAAAPSHGASNAQTGHWHPPAAQAPAGGGSSAQTQQRQRSSTAAAAPSRSCGRAQP